MVGVHDAVVGREGERQRHEGGRDANTRERRRLEKWRDGGQRSEARRSEVGGAIVRLSE